MAHKFDPGKMSKLDDSGRNILLPPREILLAAGLKAGHTFLDVGAGTGHFAFPASAIVGETGKVIAVDISDEMIRELTTRAGNRAVRNMEIRKSGEYDLMIGEGIADLALMAAVLHEIDEKRRFLQNLAYVLKPAGRLCVVEWEKGVMEMGPPVEDRLEPKETAELLTAVGFEVISEERLNDFFYRVLGVKGR